MAEATKTSLKTLGGFSGATLHFNVMGNIPGGKFPGKGLMCSVWQWGTVIHRIDQTGRHIDLAELNELEKSGKLKRIVPKKKAEPKKAIETVAI